MLLKGREAVCALAAVVGPLPTLWPTPEQVRIPSFGSLATSYDPRVHREVWAAYYPHLEVQPLPFDAIDLRHVMTAGGELPIYIGKPVNPSVNQRRIELFRVKLEEVDAWGWGLVPMTPNTPFLGLGAEELAERFAERGGWSITWRGYEIYGEFIRQVTGRYPDCGRGIRLLAKSGWGENTVVVGFQGGRRGHLRFSQKIGPAPEVGGRYFAPLPSRRG